MEFLGFNLGDKFFGMISDKIKEIVEETTITPVPLSSGYIEGVMNIRGDPIPIINLKKKIGLKGSAESSHIILCYLRDSKVGLRVDKILDIHKFTTDELKEVPPTIKKDINSKCIKGIVEVEDNKYIIIDIDEII